MTKNKNHIQIDGKDYYNKYQSAKLFKISHTTLKTWVEKKQVSYIEKNGTKYFSFEEIEHKAKKIKRYIRTQKNKSWIIKVRKKNLFWNGFIFSEELQSAKVYNTKVGCRHAISCMKKEMKKDYKFSIQEVTLEN